MALRKRTNAYWQKRSTERVPVGFDSGQTEFDTDEETGGVKEVTLTAAQSGLPAHTHTVVTNGVPPTATAGKVAIGNASAIDGTTTGANATQNASQAHTNLQPYIVVRMWKRTA